MQRLYFPCVDSFIWTENFLSEFHNDLICCLILYLTKRPVLRILKNCLLLCFLMFRLGNSKQNWPNRNGFKCSKLPSKPSLLLPQPARPIRQDLLRMKKMMMISEIHQLSFCFLYKCFFPAQEKTSERNAYL